MEAIEIAGDIVKQKGSSALLSAHMAMSEKIIQLRREIAFEGQCRHPIIRSCGKAAVQRLAQLCNQRRKRIGKVLVFAASETEARHINAAAKERHIGVERPQGFTLRAVQHLAQTPVTLRP